ncbi:MAG: hypothetical protein AB1432_08635 [Bacteroidota bacterium]
MSRKAKREYLNEIKSRYKNASKSEKKKILIPKNSIESDKLG